MNSDDVRMIERRRCARLREKMINDGAIGDSAGWQKLQRDLAPESLVPRPIDFAHPARAKVGLDLVAP
jgi:hypothetical protein